MKISLEVIQYSLPSAPTGKGLCNLLKIFAICKRCQYTLRIFQKIANMYTLTPCDKFARELPIPYDTFARRSPHDSNIKCGDFCIIHKQKIKLKTKNQEAMNPFTN
jgi:hypothetical protein